MLTQPRGGRVSAAALIVAAGLAGCSDSFETPVEPAFSANGGGARSFEVYTQNLFHGGDTEPILTLDFNDIPAVIAATNVFWTDVQNRDFPQRAVEIVDEIEERMPHVVGFQEIVQIAVLDASFQPIGGLDMLAVIEAEIANRGLPYATEVVHNATNVTLPLGFDPGIPGISQWLNFTDRVASLRRTDVPLLEEEEAEYATRFDLGPVTLKRGFARMAVEHAGETYQFVNTHLEIQQLAPVQVGQAMDLLAAVDGLEGITILAGDFNSNVAAQPGDPTWTPSYDLLVADGFLDLWEAAPPANRDPIGLTCCHDKSLVGDLPFSQRIDFVLVRSSDSDEGQWGHMLGQFRAEIVGEEDADRTDGGLWPSDHAGMVASLREPPGS